MVSERLWVIMGEDEDYGDLGSKKGENRGCGLFRRPAAAELAAAGAGRVAGGGARVWSAS